MVGMISTSTLGRVRAKRNGAPTPNPEREAAFEQAKRTDMHQLADRYSELRRKAAQEWEGPCPKCQGHDRFVVDANGWFCRQCKPFDKDHGWYGPIDFVMWMNNMSFLEAVAFLTGAQMTTPITRTQPVRAQAQITPQPQQ